MFVPQFWIGLRTSCCPATSIGKQAIVVIVKWNYSTNFVEVSQHLSLGYSLPRVNPSCSTSSWWSIVGSVIASLAVEHSTDRLGYSTIASCWPSFTAFREVATIELSFQLVPILSVEYSKCYRLECCDLQRYFLRRYLAYLKGYYAQCTTSEEHQIMYAILKYQVTTNHEKRPLPFSIVANASSFVAIVQISSLWKGPLLSWSRQISLGQTLVALLLKLDCTKCEESTKGHHYLKLKWDLL